MKNLSVRVRNYINKDGEQKGEYVKVGVMGYKQDGEPYIILDPAISLSGLKLKQDAMNAAEGKNIQNGIMTNVFDQKAQQQTDQQSQQHQGQQNQHSQQHQQQNNQSDMPPSGHPAYDEFDQEVPF